MKGGPKGPPFIVLMGFGVPALIWTDWPNGRVDRLRALHRSV